MNEFHNIKGKISWATIKLDIEEYIDRLEWRFIIKYLQELGFCQTWVNWVKECLSMLS